MPFTSVPVPAPRDEDIDSYALRLETLGFDEMRIRKEMLRHFSCAECEHCQVFDSTSDARLRYVSMLHDINPAKPAKGLVRKVKASLGISQEEAERAVARLQREGRLDYVAWFDEA